MHYEKRKRKSRKNVEQLPADEMNQNEDERDSEKTAVKTYDEVSEDLSEEENKDDMKSEGGKSIPGGNDDIWKRK
jgi:hypothetical protein